MASYNQITLVGNLGRDPEMRYNANGSPKTEFSVATTRSWKKDGEWQEETDWHNVVVWGDRAERAAENLRKGMQVLVVGRQTNRSYEDKDGNKKYRSEVIADVAHPLGSKAERDAITGYEPQGAPAAAGEFSGAPRTQSAAPALDSEFDDLPF